MLQKLKDPTANRESAGNQSENVSKNRTKDIVACEENFLAVIILLINSCASNVKLCIDFTRDHLNHLCRQHMHFTFVVHLICTC